MPDFWSHIIAGDMLINQLSDKKLLNQIKDNRTLFNFACQGPDFFYYHNLWPWSKKSVGKKLASMFHQQSPTKLMIRSLNFLKKHYEINLNVYLSGLFLHYFIDRTTHPLIFNIQKRGFDHKRLEINLDLYAVKTFYSQQVFKLSPSQKINLDKIPKIIKKYYQNIFTKLYQQQNFKLEIITKSFSDFKKTLNLFYSPLRIKACLFKMLNSILTLDLTKVIYPTNLNTKIITLNEYQKFYSLLKQAVKQTNDFLTLKDNYLNNNVDNKIIKAKIANINFAGNLV